MAKFAFYSISCSKFEDEKTKELITADSVNVQITKKVNLKTMQGELGENYKISVDDIPGVFGTDVQFPAFKGSDGTARVAAVKEFLSKYIGKRCTAEEITKGSRKILTYIEFDEE